MTSMSANAGLFSEREENGAQERIAAGVYRTYKLNSVFAAHPEAARGSVAVCRIAGIGALPSPAARLKPSWSVPSSG